MMSDRREEYRKYQGDVEYEVWRNGGNPDAVDRDRLHDRFYDGCSVEQAAQLEDYHEAHGSCERCGVNLNDGENIYCDQCEWITQANSED